MARICAFSLGQWRISVADSGFLATEIIDFFPCKSLQICSCARLTLVHKIRSICQKVKINNAIYMIFLDIFKRSALPFLIKIQTCSSRKKKFLKASLSNGMEHNSVDRFSVDILTIENLQSQLWSIWWPSITSNAYKSLNNTQNVMEFYMQTPTNKLDRSAKKVGQYVTLPRLQRTRNCRFP